jgi:hypothetical protein
MAGLLLLLLQLLLLHACMLTSLALEKFLHSLQAFVGE